MRTINITFENEEFERLTHSKGDYNWHDFVMLLTDEHGETPTIITGDIVNP